MIKVYLSSIHNALFSIKPSKATRALLVAFFVFNLFFASTVFGQTVGDYRSAGNVTFNAATNWQIYNGTAWVSTTIAPKDASYTVANTIKVQSGHTATVSISVTITAKLLVEGTFTLNGGTSLNIGPMVVNHNGIAVVVSTGSSLTVNGNLTVTKGDMSVAGTVYIDGNFSTDTGNVDVTGGGSMASSGSMTTQGSGTIFGSTGDCGTGPCSGTSLNCPSTISPPSQLICQSSQSAPIRFARTGATVVKWQSTTDFLTFIDITNTNTTLPAQTVTQTTRFRAVYTSSGCTGNVTSPYATVTVTPANTSGTASSNPTLCINTALTNITRTTTGATGIGTATGLPAGVTAVWAANTITISGTPTALGTFAYTIPLTGGCGLVNATGTITVTPANTSGTASSNPTLCINAVLTNITRTTTGATGIGTATGLPAGVTAVWAANTITISGTPTASGTFAYTIPLTGGCGAVNATGAITVTPSPSTPTITIRQPTCTIATGTITVNTPATAAGISYTVTGPSPSTTAVTNDIGIFAGMLAGTYAVSSTNPCGTSSATSATLALVKKIWDGLAWSPAGNPTADENIEFTGPYNIATNVKACSCTVTSGMVIIPAGNNLILGGKLNVNGGTLTFENNASLVQTGFTGKNVGNIIYNRNYTGGEMDYTYWSSPVAEQNLLLLSPKTKLDKFFSFNASTENWLQEVPSTTTMTDAKGYIIRGIPPPAPPALPPGFGTATFIGIPNNGNIPIAVSSGTKSNLIGNPYPSAIDADAFLTVNSDAVDGTLYFWTHNTALQDRNNILLTAGEGTLAYTSNDYAVYNLTGGVIIDGVTYVQGGTSAPSGGVKPTGKIAAGQSFFTTSTILGRTVTFNNLMRVDGSGNPLNNSNFYKTKTPKSKLATTFEKHRVWLNLSNTQGAFKQTLIGYITDATNEFDSRFDGESFDGQEYVDFYSINQEKNLTIQGRALPFDKNDEVVLGYRTTINGNFTINIDETDGVLSNQEVFLEDKLANKTVNLKEGNHTFNTKAGTFDDRFVLRYTDKTLATTDFNARENNVLVSIKNKKIQINSFAKTIDKVIIFDLLGRQIYQKNKVNNYELLLSDFVSSHQVLIIKTSLENGTTVTEKVIY